jgi:hypothetical protein
MPLSKKSELPLIAALVMRPLIRLLIQYGVGLNTLTELIKHLYVDQARETLASQGKRVTDASISVMTGVHRQDVKRLGQSTPDKLLGKAQPSVLASVMEMWTGDPRFIDAHGAPKPLKRRQFGKSAKTPRNDCFEDLIEAVSKGIPPKALLDEWLRLGAVVLNAKGEVCWRSPEFAKGEELQQLKRSLLAAGDRIDAARELLRDPAAGHALKSVRAVCLREEDARNLSALVQRWGRRLGLRLNRLAAAAEERGRKEGGHWRYSFALHSFSELSRQESETLFARHEEPAKLQSTPKRAKKA